MFLPIKNIVFLHEKVLKWVFYSSPYSPKYQLLSQVSIKYILEQALNITKASCIDKQQNSENLCVYPG